MATPNKLAGKHILLIGGTSGLGFAVAQAILSSSPTTSLTLSSSSQPHIESAITRLTTLFPNSNITGFPCDLSTPSLETNIISLFKYTASQIPLSPSNPEGKIQHIVITSGDTISRASVHESTLESIQKAGQVRFIAPILIAKTGIRYLAEGPESSIIFTGAMVGQRPMEGWAVVAGYAAGIEGVTRNLAVDLKPVRVNCVAPGPVDTELLGGMSEVQRSAVYAISEKTPVGRVGRPEDVAECYMWLMKDSNVTGFVACSDAGSKLM